MDAVNPTIPSLRSRLREVTSPLHGRLDRAFEGWLSQADRPAYVRFLAAQLGLHRPLERALAAIPWPAGSVDIVARRKSDMILADLGTLGIDATEIADCPTMPELPDAAHGLGALYVTEGSTLGGQMILRALGQRLGINTKIGGSFLASYGPAVGRQWRDFVAALEAANDNGPFAGAVEAGALATFGAFHSWLLPAFLSAPDRHTAHA